jgi:hypothetical protein
MIVPSKKPKSNDKVKQEVEINAELAPNEETTKEAEAIEGESTLTIQVQ